LSRSRTDQLRGGQRATSPLGQQFGRVAFNMRGKLCLKLTDPLGLRRDLTHQLPGDPHPGDRLGAREAAGDLAEFESDLPGSREERRTPAMYLGATRMTRSPRAIRKRSNVPDTCRQSSSAHTRSESNARAHRSSLPNPGVRAATVARRARPR
jgi:hypothetical protein